MKHIINKSLLAVITVGTMAFSNGIEDDKVKYIMDTINNGSNIDVEHYPGGMPAGMAYGKNVEEVSKYVAGGLRGEQPPSYITCAGCHGEKGQGLDYVAPSLIDLNLYHQAKAKKELEEDKNSPALKETDLGNGTIIYEVKNGVKFFNKHMEAYDFSKSFAFKELINDSYTEDFIKSLKGLTYKISSNNQNEVVTLTKYPNKIHNEISEIVDPRLFSITKKYSNGATIFNTKPIQVKYNDKRENFSFNFDGISGAIKDEVLTMDLGSINMKAEKTSNYSPEYDQSTEFYMASGSVYLPLSTQGNLNGEITFKNIELFDVIKDKSIFEISNFSIVYNQNIKNGKLNSTTTLNLKGLKIDKFYIKEIEIEGLGNGIENESLNRIQKAINLGLNENELLELITKDIKNIINKGFLNQVQVKVTGVKEKRKRDNLLNEAIVKIGFELLPNNFDKNTPQYVTRLMLKGDQKLLIDFILDSIQIDYKIKLDFGQSDINPRTLPRDFRDIYKIIRDTKNQFDLNGSLGKKGFELGLDIKVLRQ